MAEFREQYCTVCLRKMRAECPYLERCAKCQRRVRNTRRRNIEIRGAKPTTVDKGR